MTRGFGPTIEPGWTGQNGTSAVNRLLQTLVPNADKLPPSTAAVAYDLIGEGVQQLEHASLIRLTYQNNIGGRLYVLTRRGRDALAQNNAAALLLSSR